MKTIFLGLFSMIMFVATGQQKEKTIIATFSGYEEGVYSFSNSDDEVFEFEKINANILKDFDLKSEKYLNKKFKITYKEETIKVEEDGNEEEYEVWTITKLELVKQE